jgi:Zn finger protein HypA/HybF involved in hydrogenase expression
MGDFLSDREKSNARMDAILKKLEHPMDFRCGNCGTQYVKLSTDKEWHICPKCKRSMKP